MEKALLTLARKLKPFLKSCNMWNVLVLVLLLSGILLSEKSIAQENVQSIDLATVLELGGANNLTIKQYRQLQEKALADVYKSKEWWLPEIHGGIRVHQLWGNAMNTDGTIFENLNRQFFLAGAGVNASWDFSEIYSVRANELTAEATQYMTQAQRNEVLLQALEVYFDFLTADLYYRTFKVLVDQSELIGDQMKKQVDGGLQFESDWLLAMSNYNHLKVQMLNAKADYIAASAKLVQMLNLSPTIVLVTADTLLLPLDLVSEDEVIGTDTGFEELPFIKSIDLIIMSLESRRSALKKEMAIPNFQLGINGSAFGDLFSPIGPRAAINSAITWRIPLGRLAYGGDFKQFDSKIILNQIKIEEYKAKISEDIVKARGLIVNAKEQMKLAEESAGYAEEAIDQNIQRQEFGIVRPYEILQAQEIYINSQFDYIKAVADYNKAQYRLYVALGNDL